jgi:urease alpha subunit
MGYILKNSTGGAGVGDATKANQNTQIAQCTDPTTGSVFLNSSGDSVFINPSTGVSIVAYTEAIAQSTLDTLNSVNGVKNVINRSQSNNIGGGTTLVQSFTATTLAAACLLLQNFLQVASTLYIINISFSSAGATQHDIILVYNI